MSPDLQRLCQAALAGYEASAFHSRLDLDDAEIIVRAVLLSLKEMEWCATQGAERVSRVGDGGWTERADPEQEFAAAIDHILAELATA